MSQVRQILLDSELHYQFQKSSDGIALVEFTTEGDEAACPGMGHRGPYTKEEGRVIATFSLGEKVEFIYAKYQTEAGDHLLKEKISCGDDLRYLFKEVHNA